MAFDRKGAEDLTSSASSQVPDGSFLDPTLRRAILTTAACSYATNLTTRQTSRL